MTFINTGKTRVLAMATGMFLICGAACGTVLTVDDLAPGDLAVTEYLADPVTVSDGDGEYFEVFNRSGSSVDLAGLVVRDDGVNSFTVSALLLAPASFAVFSNADGSALGLSPDYIYGGSMSLTNGEDEIGLYRADDTLLHKAVFGDGDFFGDGIAHELAALGPGTPLIVTGPADGSDFVAATAALLSGNFGSPGAAGNTLFELSVVPLPPAAWLFASALALLTRRRLRAGRAAQGI